MFERSKLDAPLPQQSS